MTAISTPEFMVDEDGAPIGVRRDRARSRAGAVRYVVEDMGFDWWLEELTGTWTADESRYVIDRSELRQFVTGVVPGWMRPAETEDEMTGEFGKDSWLWCFEDHPNAVPYWRLEP